MHITFPRFGAIAPLVYAGGRTPGHSTIGFFSNNIDNCVPNKDVVVFTNSEYKSGACAVPLSPVEGQDPDCAGVMFTRSNQALETGLETMKRKFSGEAAKAFGLEEIGQLAQDTLHRFKELKTPDEFPVTIPIVGAQSPREEQGFAEVLQGKRTYHVEQVHEVRVETPIDKLSTILVGLIKGDESLFAEARAAYDRYIQSGDTDIQGTRMAREHFEQLTGKSRKVYQNLKKQLQAIAAQQPKLFSALSQKELQGVFNSQKKLQQAVEQGIMEYSRQKHYEAFMTYARQNREKVQEELKWMMQLLHGYDGSEFEYRPAQHAVVAQDDYVFAKAVHHILMNFWHSDEDRAIANVARQTLAALVSSRLTPRPQ